MHYDVLIAGAGHAGSQLAVQLRQQGFAGSIGLFGEEAWLPYERPPLSKDYLAGDKSFERILLRPEAFWATKNIDLHRGKRISRVAVDAHEVRQGDGAGIAYGKLVWAAGGTPRTLSCPGHGLAGVHHVRTRDDVDALAAELPAAARVAVIGGGFIGLEAAAVLRKLGKTVTLVEALDRLLARVAAEPLSRFYEREHTVQGVELLLSAQVDRLHEKDGRLSGVELRDGRVIPADIAIVGIGIEPAIGPLAAAGARQENGVWVDEYCRTSLPDIFAIGDCASHLNAFAAGARVRIESVQNANDQAITVARYLTGKSEPYDAIPWFWSNQYDLRLQTVGLSTAYDDVVVRGDIDSRSFSVIYLRDGAVIALDCVNATKDYVQGRRLVLTAARVPADMLSNAAIPLKDIKG